MRYKTFIASLVLSFASLIFGAADEGKESDKIAEVHTLLTEKQSSLQVQAPGEEHQPVIEPSVEQVDDSYEEEPSELELIGDPVVVPEAPVGPQAPEAPEISVLAPEAPQPKVASIEFKNLIYSIMCCARQISDSKLTVSLENKTQVDEPNLEVNSSVSWYYSTSFFYLYFRYKQEADSQICRYLLESMASTQRIKADIAGKKMKFNFYDSNSGALSEALSVTVAGLMAVTGANLVSNTIFLGEVDFKEHAFAYRTDFVRKVKLVIGSYERVVVPEMAREWIDADSGLTGEQKSKIVYIAELSDLNDKGLFDKDMIDNSKSKTTVWEGIGSHPLAGGGLLKLQLMLLPKNPGDEDVVIGNREKINVTQEMRDLKEQFPELNRLSEEELKALFLMNGVGGGPSWGLLGFFLLIYALRWSEGQSTALKSIPITGRVPRTIAQIKDGLTMWVNVVGLKSNAAKATYAGSGVTPKIVIPKSNVKDVKDVKDTDIQFIIYNDKDYFGTGYGTLDNMISDKNRKKFNCTLDKVTRREADKAEEDIQDKACRKRIAEVDNPGELFPKVLTKNPMIKIMYFCYLFTVFPIAYLLQLVCVFVGWIGSKCCKTLEKVGRWNVDVNMALLLMQILISPTYLVDLIATLLVKAYEFTEAIILFSLNLITSAFLLICRIFMSETSVTLEPWGAPDRLRKSILKRTQLLRCQYVIYKEMYMYKVK